MGQPKVEMGEKIAHLGTFAHLENFLSMNLFHIDPGWTLGKPREASGCRLNFFK